MAYDNPTNVTMNAEGAVVETLRNHRLSEKDISEELFFILLVIFVPLPQSGTLLLL
jgi:hypothetical protein